MISKHNYSTLTNCYAVILIIFIASGCAAKAPVPSAYLGTRVTLQQCDNDPSIQWWESEDFAWTRYNKVMLEPVGFSCGDAGDIDQQEMDELSEYAHRAIMDSLSPDFILTRDLGPGVLRIRLRITEIVKSRPLLNVITTTAVFVPLDMGGASIEAEFYDGEKGELMAAMTSKKRGTPLQVLGSLRQLGHAKSALDAWAKELKVALVTNP